MLAAPDPPLTDGVVVVRERRRSDGALAVVACQDPEITRWTAVPSPYGEAQWNDFHERAADAEREGTELHLVVADPGDRYLGTVGLNSVDRARGYGEVGYLLAPWARGRGLMTRAVRLLTTWALDELDFRTLEILVHRDNAASRAVAARAGYRATAERRPAPRVAGATARDHVVYVWPA